MIEDCIALISQSDKKEKKFLKKSIICRSLTSAEKRELQQIILKKDRMSQEEEALIKI
jgi:hypothetical protein